MDAPLLITVAHGVAMLGAAAVLGLIWRRDRSKVYALCWAGCFALLSGGWVLLTALEPPEHKGLSVPAAVAADLPFLLGFFLLTDGTARYFGKRLWLLPAVAVNVVGLIGAMAAVAADAPILREVAIAGAQGVMQVWAVVLLARYGRRNAGETAMLLSVGAMAVQHALYLALLYIDDPVVAISPSFSGFAMLMMIIPVTAVLVSLSGTLTVCLQLIGESEATLATLKAAQKRLVETEKAASLGGLVAGVAHEINTPLGIALSVSTHLADQGGQLSRKASANELRRSDLDKFLRGMSDATGLITGNLERVADLVERFKQVAANQSSTARRRFALNACVEEAVAILRPRWAEVGHRFDVACPEGIELDGYPTALAQVLTQLVTNSLVHGYEDGRAGTLSLSMALLGEDGVELVYADDGRGIAPEHRPKVFDPFFTTRRGAGSAGLGLHTAYNLVTVTLGGHIELDSAEGQGTRVTMRLPRVAPE